jgi:magnesium chelatase subunit D
MEGPERLEVVPRPIKYVDLPMGTTEDRLVGALDLEAALSRGEKRFEPGLLARAHRGILYVDEVNLLSDHIVDLLLDAAAMGVNHVEREGVSISHACRFLLVGTMNPEEGDLRPQLLDRFGLCVEVKGIADLEDRTLVARRRVAFDGDHKSFVREFSEREAALSRRIGEGRDALDEVEVPDLIWEQAARFSLAFEVEGHRSDITMVRTARALAALEGRKRTTVQDLGQAAALALPHRQKGLDGARVELDEAKLEQLLQDADGDERQSGLPAAGSKKNSTS